MTEKVLFIRHLSKLAALCVIGFASIGCTIHYTIENRLRKSITYKKALDIFYSKEDTLNYLGKPIREGAITVKEEAKFSVNVKGSKTKGVLNFEYEIQPNKSNEIKKAEIKFDNIPDQTFVIHNNY